MDCMLKDYLPSYLRAECLEICGPFEKRLNFEVTLIRIGLYLDIFHQKPDVIRCSENDQVSGTKARIDKLLLCQGRQQKKSLKNTFFSGLFILMHIPSFKFPTLV